jgi:L,D-transpeptidase YcbB
MAYRKLRWTHLLALLLIGVALQAQASTASLSERIRQHLNSARYPLKIADEPLKARKLVDQFYAARGYAPAWSDAEGLNQTATDLYGALSHAQDDGLDPQVYHTQKIAALIEQAKVPPQSDTERAAWADLELLLSDAFFHYGTHLLSGRIAPESIYSDWISYPRQRDLIGLLENTLSTRDMAGALHSLWPAHPEYERLRDALARMRAGASTHTWPVVSDGPKLEPGAKTARVTALQKRLESAGYAAVRAETTTYDATLVEAVKRFQAQHGLEPDGVVGKGTIAALNVSLAQRIRQIEMNMERWRWLPDDFGKRHILVNVADFQMHVVDHDQIPLTMRVVAGRPSRPTPVFSKQITYLVLNPFWEVPPKIARTDIVDHVLEEPDYLEKNGIQVFEGWDEASTIDPTTLNWEEIKATGQFPFRLRQDPGSQNALGQVKFMLPNMFNVYLHDTPSKRLFNKTMRAFSSGCVRLQKPLELLHYIMKDNAKWPASRIQQVIDSGQEKIVSLPAPLPVHIVYMTAWADPDGIVQFRQDIYKRDAKLAGALYRW